jgi:HSP20 family protein
MYAADAITLIWIKAGPRAAGNNDDWRLRRAQYGGRLQRRLSMVTNADHLHALMTLQRALERSFDSDWLRGSTAGTGSFPPINIFQQGEDFVAIAELPGVSKTDIEIQVQDKAIRISGRKTVQPKGPASIHRRERISGVFDRTIALPVQVDADRLKAEYQNGMLALFIPRAESDKPRTIKVG